MSSSSQIFTGRVEGYPAFTRSLVAPGVFRLFLALVVVLQHFTSFNFGKWAVYVFFMLSGYWISVMYNDKYQHTRNKIVTFLCSRFWRLFPLYVVTTLIGGLILKLSSKHWPVWDGLIHNPWWIARELLIVSSSDQPLLMDPTWSLDIEMQFYLIAPLLILWMMKASSRRACWVLAGCAVACAAFWRGGDLPKFIAPFLAGMLIYRCRWRPGAIIGVGSLAAVALAVCIGMATEAGRQILIFDPHGGSPAANHYLCLGLALLAAPYVAFTVRQPGSRLDHHFGNLAYSVYLSHGCVYVFCIYYSGFHDPLRRTIGHLGWLLVPIVAVAVYALVDQPSERLRKRFVARRVKRAISTPALDQPPGLADAAS